MTDKELESYKVLMRIKSIIKSVDDKITNVEHGITKIKKLLKTI